MKISLRSTSLISVKNQLYADGITATALKHALFTRTPSQAFQKILSSLRQTFPIYLSGTAGGVRIKRAVLQNGTSANNKDEKKRMEEMTSNNKKMMCCTWCPGLAVSFMLQSE